MHQQLCIAVLHQHSPFDFGKVSSRLVAESLLYTLASATLAACCVHMQTQHNALQTNPAWAARVPASAVPVLNDLFSEPLYPVVQQQVVSLLISLHYCRLASWLLRRIVPLYVQPGHRSACNAVHLHVYAQIHSQLSKQQHIYSSTLVVFEKLPTISY